MTVDELRQLILEAAYSVPQIGEVMESVKWGQPSFTPAKPGIGSSVRIQETPDGTFALMFICHTNLVDRFRQIYPDELVYQGNRAISVDPPNMPFDLNAARHCIAMALSYHLDRKA
jgi:hypothetical protein